MTELDKLLASLTASVTSMQSSMSASGAPPFCSDDPAPHPWDGGLPDPLGWYARKAVIGLCHQIITLVQDPIERSIVDQFGITLPASMNTVVEVRPTVAELVLAAGSPGVALNEVASKTGLDEIKLRSIMRMLTTCGYFKEVTTGHIAPTRSTRALLSDAFVSNLSGLIDVTLEAASGLPHAAKMPSDASHPTPFESYHKVGVYGWMRANPEHLHSFNLGMSNAETAVEPGLVTDLPVDDLGPSITLVDVGSGLGGLSMQFLRRYPGWKAVLQDQPAVVEDTRAFWIRNAAEIVNAGRVSFLAHSFFDPMPLPPAPKDSPYVFMIKSVLHNWPDDLALNILQNLVPAAPVGTRLMIINYTPAEPQEPKMGVEEFFEHIQGKSMSEIQELDLPVPRPLGVGWGYGSACISVMDALMMLNVGSRCRTETDFKELLQTSSWRMDKKTEYRGATSVIKATRI